MLTKLTFFSITALLAVACGASDRMAPITVEDLVENPEKYLNKSNFIEACLNVTRHGMTFVQCGKINEQITFEAAEGASAEYDRILKTGFRHYGSHTDDIRVRLFARFERIESSSKNYRLRVERVVAIQIPLKGDGGN